LSGGYLKSIDDKWAPGEPNNGGEFWGMIETIGMILSTGGEIKLYDVSQYAVLKYVCEFGKY
jgi:hypothetical protein